MAEQSNLTKLIEENLQTLTSKLTGLVSYDNIWKQLKEGVKIVSELDKSFTKMRRASNASLLDLKAYGQETFRIASQLGTTSKALQESTADWMRLGLQLEEAKKAAKDTSVLFNTSDFKSIDDAAKSLTGISKIYQELDRTAIIDKLNYASRNHFISTSDLTSLLQQSSEALKAAGNDIDEIIAMSVSANRILKDLPDSDKILKTVSLRILGTKTAKNELSGLGGDTDDFTIHSRTEFAKQIRTYTSASSNHYKGVQILDKQGNYKSTYEILQNIADVYNEIIEADKKAGTNNAQKLTTLLAGTKYSDALASILSNGNLLRSVYTGVSQNSDGSAQQELDLYLDSIEGKLNTLTNSWQEFWAASIDSEVIKFFLDLADSITKLGTKLGGVLPVLLEIGTAYASLKGVGKRISCFVFTKMPTANRRATGEYDYNHCRRVSCCLSGPDEIPEQMAA